MAGLKIPKHKHMSLKQLNTYLEPDKIYIPLISGGDTDLEVYFNIGDTVKKGDVIARRKTSFKTPIFSSVSGKIIGEEEVSYQTGIKVNALVIENDKKETAKNIKVRKDIDKLTKEEYIDIVNECGIVGMGGAGFPTNLKYKTDTKINTLLVNAVECEPYITADYTLLKEKCEDVLETIDYILTINDINEAIIAIKENNVDLIKHVLKYKESYLKIRVVEVPNKYPMGWERTLIKEILKVEYDKLPLEKGIVVNNVSTIYGISQALKFNKPIIERIVTFTGEGIKEPQNVLVKVGTKVDEVIEYLGGTKKNVFVVAGGPMMGHKVETDLVVTPELNCVLVLPKIKTMKEVGCLRCGRCVKYCPASLTPVLIKDAIKDRDKLVLLHPEKCISCGLCSYVCPSKIDVREQVNKAKEVLKGGK